MLEKESLKSLLAALETLEAGFASPDDKIKIPSAVTPRFVEVLQSAAKKLQDNYPYFHPLYAGQMLKPPHPIARTAYALAQWINPNNHAFDGGRASSAMEKEAVAEIARMFGWPQHLGHLCGGGTMANLEALWVAGQLARMQRDARPGQPVHVRHRRVVVGRGMVVLVLLQDLEYTRRRSVAEFAGRARRGGDADPIAINIHPLIGQRDDGDDRAGFRALRIPVEFAVGELFGVFFDPLGERGGERQCGGHGRNAAELTTVHSI